MDMDCVGHNENGLAADDHQMYPQIGMGLWLIRKMGLDGGGYGPALLLLQSCPCQKGKETWPNHGTFLVNNRKCQPAAASGVRSGGVVARMESSSKRMRAAMTTEEEPTLSQGSAGGGVAASSGVAVTATATETEGGEMAVEAEEQQLGSAETEENVQRILLAIENFTRQVSEMLETGRALFRDLATDFEERLCSIHKEKVERWEEMIRDLRARDAANEEARTLLHNAQLHLLHTLSD